MRWVAGILAVGLILVLFALTATDNPPEDLATTIPSATPTTSQTTTSTITPHTQGLVGALPDSTRFSVIVEPEVDQTVTGIHGAIVIDVDGRPMAVGILKFFGIWTEVPVYQGGVYRPGRSRITIGFYEEVLAALGENAEDVIRSSIRAMTVDGYPTLELDPPFRWATDQELPVQMEITTESFSVRRGCGPLAVACSGNGAVQVIPLDRLFAPAPVWTEADVFIESTGSSRPAWDSSYIDPGPLSPRYFADVMWTGTEMVVWGGSDSGFRPNLADGAGFDPETNHWRMLAPAPLSPRTATRAVLAGDRMIVVAREATLAYDIGTDTWIRIAKGAAPPEIPGRLAWDGTSVYLWSDEMLRLDVVLGQWVPLPNPDFQVGREPWMKQLRVLGTEVVAVGASGPCAERSTALWRGAEWLMLAVDADCSTPRQSVAVGDQLIAWGDRGTSAVRLRSDSRVMVSGIGSPPLRGMEGAAGALVMDRRLLIPEYGFAAIYDFGTATWSWRVIPGYGTEWDMVWTGEEVLMWGVPLCCVDLGEQVDAWRWTPPVETSS